MSTTRDKPVTASESRSVTQKKANIESTIQLTISVAQAAASSDLSPRFLWAEIKSGRLRVVRKGRRTLIPVSALREFLGIDEK